MYSSKKEGSNFSIIPEKFEGRKAFLPSLEEFGFISSLPCKPLKNNSTKKNLIQSTIQPKRRSIHYTYAKENLFSLKDLGQLKPLDISIICRHFKNWIETYSNSYIQLTRDNEEIFIKAINRFCSSYKKQVKNRMKKYREMDWDLKFEVTLNPNNFLNLGSEFEYLPYLWNLFRLFFTRKFGKMEFIRVLEISKKNRPHLHILMYFYNKKSKEYIKSFKNHKKRKWDLIKECKSYSLKNNGGWIYLREISGNLILSDYVFKYINKSISFDENKQYFLDNLNYSALLFASNKRLFTISRGLVIFSDKNKIKQGFTYVGVVSALILQTICKEHNIKFDYKIIISREIFNKEYEYFNEN